MLAFPPPPDPLQRHPTLLRIPASSARRSLFSRVKIWVGGVGLLLSGLWWLLLAALLFTPDPAPALDGLFLNFSVTLVTVSLLLTVLFLVFLRSGLRGPSDPFAPRQDSLRMQPHLPSDPSPAPSSRKKRHLRVVRNVP